MTMRFWLKYRIERMAWVIGTWLREWACVSAYHHNLQAGRPGGPVMGRGPTGPVEQQDVDRLTRLLEAILKELRAIRAALEGPGE